MVAGVNHDGEVRMKYYRTGDGTDHYDEWGWIKFDLTGVPTGARVKKARMFYYTIDFGFDYEDPKYWGWALYMITQDPQATPWTDLKCVPNPNYPTQDFMWYGRTAGYGWYPDDGLHNNLTPFVPYMNEAIAKGQGWVAFKIEGC
jgi:hypothetical protein